MASIGFRLKSKENRQVSIYIYFRPANSKVVSARTGLTINPKDWSSSKKKAKTLVPGSLGRLINKLNQYNEIYDIWEMDIKEIIILLPKEFDELKEH